MALSLTLILSFLFSLLEAARVQCCQPLSGQDMLLRLQSAFGAYNVPLWEDYRMLFYDGGNGKGEFDISALEGEVMREAALEQCGEGFFGVALKNFEISDYGLAADSGGAAFRESACRAIQDRLAAGAAEALRDTLVEGGKLADGEQSAESQWGAANDAVAEAEAGMDAGEGEEDADSGDAGSGEESAQPACPNPMDGVEQLKKSSILYTVAGNPSEISGKSISVRDCLAKRKKESGTMGKAKGSPLGNLWFLQYLNYYFSCQAGAGEGGSAAHALDYELEYCIAGKNSDQKNLEKTVRELLLLREVGNYATIGKDAAKQAAAYEVALTAVGFTGLAPLVQAVKTGVLLAWCYIESIQDVRCLLKGGSVPLIKEPSEWQSDISLGTAALKEEPDSGQGSDGLEYREYLMILLSLVGEKKLAYRAMDIMEQNVRLQPGHENFRMDHQVYGVCAEGMYTVRTMFLTFVPTGRSADGTYAFWAQKEASYLSQ